MTGFLSAACLLLVFALGFWPCVRSKVQLKAYVISFAFLLIATLLVHVLSLEMGREGFSIFVKNDLVDDKLYHVTAKHLAESFFLNQGSIDGYLQKQQALFGYASAKSAYFAALAAPLYHLFGSDVLHFKFLIILFSALLVSNLVKSSYFKLGQERVLLIIALMILSYPTFLIRSVQVEKDTFLLLLFLVAFIELYKVVLGERFSRLTLAAVIALLALYRPQYSLTLFLAFVYAKFLLPKTKKAFALHVALLVALIPLPVLLIKALNPAVFELLVAIKRYSVLAGKSNVIAVDYSSYLGILKTVGTSFYYFLFAPISPYALKGGMLWLLMIVEPVIWFILPLFYIAKNHRYSANFRKVFFFLLAITLILALLSVYYESHIGSYMRKRMPVYFVWMYVAVRVYIDKVRYRLAHAGEEVRHLQAGGGH
ncbi:hypothetical protein D3C87_1135020 [compost metagenome]